MNNRACIRLLQIAPEELPTYRADVSVLFGKYLPRNGVECDLVGMPGGNELANQNFASIKCSQPSKNRLLLEANFLSTCLSSLLKANKKNCDLIQIRDMVPIGLLALVIARLKGIPFVYWASFLFCESRIERGRNKINAGAGFRFRLILLKGLLEHTLLYRCLLPAADHIFVQSEAMKLLMVRKGIAHDKMTAVPMGVDTETLLSANINKRRLPEWHDYPTIAFLGTLDRSRRLPILIEVLLLVKQKHPSARLLFIGDGPNPDDTEELLAAITQYNLQDSVHITGWLPSEQARAYLNGADLAISYFARCEILDTNSPTKLLEYLALAIPSVGNDNPDQAQLLSSADVGWLTDSTALSMANAICEILDDLPAARKKAASGPAFIDSRRSYRVLSELVAQQYRNIIHGYNP